MKRSLIIFFAIFALASCEKDLTSLNEDTKHPTSAPSGTLFSSGQRNLSDIMASTNVNRNIFRLLAQQWTQTTYFDESQYDISTRNIPFNFFTILYRDVLRDLQEAKSLINNDLTSAEVKANQTAIADIMQVYAFHILVNTYGNVPYSEALDYTKIFPKYDDAKTIELDLIKRLDADIAALNPAAESFGSADLLYGGDVAAWIKFAQTLKLKIGMLLADDDPALSKATVEQAAPNVFSSNADNAEFKYLATTPNTNPVWVDVVFSGRSDFVAANTMVDKMNQLNDPRLPQYFTLSATNDYKGGIYGTSNNYTTFSKPGAKLVEPTLPHLFLDYSEVEFDLAEAVERGYNVGGTAIEHYNNGIRASILYWGGTEAEVTAYLLNPAVNYLTAPGTYKEKIGVQKWIALYNRGWEAWTEWRRLDFPVLNVPPGLTYADIPVRFLYPANEQNLNPTNYAQAASAIGGDDVKTKLFWDKF